MTTIKFTTAALTLLVTLSACVSTVEFKEERSKSETGGECGEELLGLECYGCEGECIDLGVGSACAPECCPEAVERSVNSGESWTFRTSHECMIQCEGAELTCPAGMVCETTYTLCVWA